MYIFALYLLLMDKMCVKQVISDALVFHLFLIDFTFAHFQICVKQMVSDALVYLSSDTQAHIKRLVQAESSERRTTGFPRDVVYRLSLNS